MKELSVPVLIVGGGGAGLTASMALSSLGVNHLLVSAFAGTSILPKAHVLNQRAMEIFTEVGVAGEIYKRSTPAENMRATGWYAGMAGDHEAYGRSLGHLEAWGGGYTDPDYIAASSCRTCNLPQIRLEPVLRAHADKLNPGNVRFHHELTALEEGADGVTATVLNKDTNEALQVKARYLLAADGGRTVGKMVGVDMTGMRDIMKMVSIHMTADLSRWLHDDDVLIRWLVNPAFGGSWASGVLVSMGPDHWGTKSEEWVFHMKYATDDAEAMKDEKVLDRMRTTLGVKDLKAEVHKISTWVMEGVISDRFRKGNIFFLGDAAHRHPPTGGLGLTSAVHDAYNLCWKLSLVLAGKAGDRLLDTYEAERKPVDQANIDCSIGNAMNHFKIDQALSLSDAKTAEQNWDELLPLWDESLPGSAEKRHALNARSRPRRWSFTITTWNSAIVTIPRPWSRMAALSMCRWTRFACTSRVPSPVIRCRTRLSRFRATVFRWAASLRAAISWLSPAKKVVHGWRPPGNWPRPRGCPSRLSRWGWPTATTSTYGWRG